VIDTQAAAELEQIANDAAAVAEEENTREAHVKAEAALYSAAYAYDGLRQMDKAAPLWRQALKHRDAAERARQVEMEAEAER